MAGRFRGPFGGSRGGGRRGRYFSTDGPDGSSDASGRGSHRGGPQGLRGKDIGLYYRDMARRKREERQREETAEIRRKLDCALNPRMQEQLIGVIERLGRSQYRRTASNVKFQERYQKNLEGNEMAEVATDLDVESGTFEDLAVPKGLTEELTWLRGGEWSSDVNTRLKEELGQKLNEPGFQRMLDFRKKLPAYKLRDEIVNTIDKNQVVVISGETGCGKTTQVGQYILDNEINSGRGSVCNIVCTQPRRISAISVAERVAHERQEKLGISVGYSIRLENRSPSRRSGIMTFMTTGILFQHLRNNKLLQGISHLMIDEIHERSIHSDFLITLLKDILPKRPDLKVILMSATMNAAEFSAYYNNAPIITIPGFTYPVKTYYLEDALEQTRFSFGVAAADRRLPYGRRRYGAADSYRDFIFDYVQNLEKEGTFSPHVVNQLRNPACEEFSLDFIQALLEHICRIDKGSGAILIFAIGWSEISKLIKQIQTSGKFPASKYRIYPLHSMMPTMNQREIFDRPPQGVRKIIVSTQIAETSITIDDIVYVLDCGKIKMSNFDENSNLATLGVEWVSKANALQRRGRAGRVQEGIVYHLYSKAREAALEPFMKPEVLRTRLEEVILQVKILELGRADFLKRLMDPPSSKSIDLALERLFDLHAIELYEERLTPLGFHLAELPMDPQTGKMILMAAIFSCVDPIFSIAACLSFKDPFVVPMGKEAVVDQVRVKLAEPHKSDHVMYAKVMKEYEDAVRAGYGRKYAYDHFLSENTLRMLSNMKQQFADYLLKLGFLPDTNYKSAGFNRNSNNYGVIKAITAAGLYPNVALVEFVGGKHAPKHFMRSEGQKVSFFPSSVNNKTWKFESPYIVYYKKIKSTGIYLHDSGVLNPLGLIFFGGRLDWDRLTEDQNEDLFIVQVDGKYDLAYPKHESFRVIIDALRAELDKFLEFKINNPGPTDTSEESKEHLLTTAIIDTITSEHEVFQEDADRGQSSRQRRY